MMSFKLSIFVTVAVILQTISSQSIGSIPSGIGIGGLPPGGFGAGMPFGCGVQFITVGSLAASRGGPFSVSSASPTSPTGVSVYSENAIEGNVDVNGQLPFLGAVGFEGAVPAEGQSVIDYGCGNGEIGIEKEEIPAQNGLGGFGGPFGSGFGW